MLVPARPPRFACVSSMSSSQQKCASQRGAHKLGLTGSIGMGKSTVSQMFVSHGIPLWDADQAVHDLYSKGGAAVQAVGAAFPGCIEEEGLNAVQDAIKQLEGIVHPLVALHRHDFLQHVADATDHRLIVLDIPLLFEVHGEDQTDSIAVVSAPLDIQKARVLARPGMTEDKFMAILKRQVPDEEKRRRADFVIDTSCTLEETQQQVATIISKLQHI